MTTIRILDGNTGITTSVVSTNTAQNLPALTLTNAQGKRSNGVLITVETADIRYAFNATPTIAGLGHTLEAGTTIILNHPRSVAMFNFISKTTSTPATLQVTPII